MTDSGKADGDLVIGYDLGDDVSYSAFTLARHNEDGTLEIIESETLPGPISRAQLVKLCVSSLKKHRPKVARVRIAAGPLITIHHRTLEEILNDEKTWTDLLIGS